MELWMRRGGRNVSFKSFAGSHEGEAVDIEVSMHPASSRCVHAFRGETCE